jgi:hypothetical protein
MDTVPHPTALTHHNQMSKLEAYLLLTDCFSCLQENRNPNRQHWLLELLMEDPLRDEASFIECGLVST